MRGHACYEKLTTLTAVRDVLRCSVVVLRQQALSQRRVLLVCQQLLYGMNSRMTTHAQCSPSTHNRLTCLCFSVHLSIHSFISSTKLLRVLSSWLVWNLITYVPGLQDAIHTLIRM